MSLYSNLRAMLSMIFRRSGAEREMEEELRLHIQHRVEDLRSRGISPAEAERQARIEFGGSERFKDECREAMGTHFFDTLFQDLRIGVRMLRRAPGFTAVAVATLALGIAVNSTMFSLMSAILLERPPGREPDRVAVVTTVDPAPVFQGDATPASAPNYFVWRAANHVFEDMAAADEGRRVSLTSQRQSNAVGDSAGADQPEVVPSAAATLNYFSVLGVAPQLGRTFAAGEDQPGRDHLVILSHDLWARRFGSDPAIVGSTIRFDRENYNVIGVMPQSFRMLGFTPQLWTPLVVKPADQTAAARRNRSLYLFARMKRGTTLEQAKAEMITLGRLTEQSFPETEKGWRVAVRTLPDFLIYALGARTGIEILMTAVGFVLLIACANVAGLLLARASGRQRELAVRVALGAGRSRIVRQLLTEGLLIAILGGGAGLLLAYWGIGFMRASLAINEVVKAVPLSLDWKVVTFTLVVSLVSALLCGIAPAWSASRADLNINLNSEGRSAAGGRGRSRLRMALVTAEIAIASFLLVGVGLLIHMIYDIEHQNLGFRTEHLLTANLTLDEARYKDAERKKAFARDVLARLQQMPGTEAAAATSDLPASGFSSVPLRIKDQPELPAEQKLSAFDFVVTSDYFRVTGIPLMHGRAFTEMDNATSPAVVIVNQEFVHRYLQDKEPLGQQIQLETGDTAPRWSQIVGVAGNIKTYSEESRYDPEVYEPYFQRSVASLALVVRATSDPNALASSLRDAVGQVDPELPLSRLMSMPALIDSQRGTNPFAERALGSFALLALILAAIGIYGLIAYSVSQRMQEIGIRMALGANRASVLRMILWDGGKMSAIGAFIGLAMALPLPKLFEAILYGRPSYEPWVYLIVPVVLFAVAMFAAYIPARRATRVDPLIALRYE